MRSFTCSEKNKSPTNCLMPLFEFKPNTPKSTPECSPLGCLIISSLMSYFFKHNIDNVIRKPYKKHTNKIFYGRI